jgi:hypothetical protein
MINSLHSSNFSPFFNQQMIKVKDNLSKEEAKQEASEETKLNLSGNIYQANSTNHKTLADYQLNGEEIEKQVAKNGGVVVAFDSGVKDGEVITTEISQELFAKLKDEFGNRSFYSRDDGMIRLNSKANNYISAWHKEISLKRGYLEADKDGNGVIEGNESKELKVGFDRGFNYNFYNDKITEMNSNSQGGYERYGDTINFLNRERGSSDIYSQHINFESSIEDELEKTILSDKNFDKIVSLEEGLEREYGSLDKAKKVLLQETQILHNKYLRDATIPPPRDVIVNRDLGILKVKPDEITLIPLDDLGFGDFRAEVFKLKFSDANQQEQKINFTEQKLHNSSFDPSDISLIGIDIKSFNKSTLQVSTNNKDVELTHLEAEYSTHEIAGVTKRPMDADGHIRLTKLLSNIDVVA